MISPATKLVEKFGGPEIVARVTGRASTAPYRWQHTKDKGGTGGLVPQRYHRALLDYAEANGIDWKAEDFLPPRETEAA